MHSRISGRLSGRKRELIRKDYLSFWFILEFQVHKLYFPYKRYIISIKSYSITRDSRSNPEKRGNWK